MSNDNRRSAPRTATKIPAVIRLIENLPPHTVIGECQGIVIDAAYVDRMLVDIVKSDDLSRYIL